VGGVLSVAPSLEKVDVLVEIKDSGTVIPRNSMIEANQSGLIAEPLIDITPQLPIPEYTGVRSVGAQAAAAHLSLFLGVALGACHAASACPCSPHGKPARGPGFACSQRSCWHSRVHHTPAPA
jgi:hypothetical protein